MGFAGARVIWSIGEYRILTQYSLLSTQYLSSFIILQYISSPYTSVFLFLDAYAALYDERWSMVDGTNSSMSSLFLIRNTHTVVLLYVVLHTAIVGWWLVRSAAFIMLVALS